ncbi:unnamed protein product [Malus baccata var. baccata]
MHLQRKLGDPTTSSRILEVEPLSYVWRWRLRYKFIVKPPKTRKQPGRPRIKSALQEARPLTLKFVFTSKYFNSAQILTKFEFEDSY